MDLLERYIQAIRKYLPSRRHDDILAELRTDFEAQLEEREAALGRPLTEGEMIDWIKQLGPPMQVAARYQPMQYLIGPTLFPIYLYVQRVALFWTIVIYLLVALITLWATPPSAGSVFEWILRAPGVLLNTAIWITIVFAALEYAMAHFPQVPIVARICAEWSPATLPPLDPGKTGKRRNVAQAAAEVIFGYLFLVWLVLIPRYPFLWLGPGAYYLRALPFTLAPICWTFFWTIVALNCIQVVWNTIDLFRGTWRNPWRVKPIVYKACGLIGMGVLVAAPDHIYAVLANPAQNAEKYGATLDAINTNIWRGAIVICLIVAAQMLWEVYAWLRDSRSRAQ